MTTRRIACLPLALVLVFLLAGTANAAATLTVTSTANSGTGSLRATVAGAASGDTIVLPARAEHYMVTSGEIAIANKDLTIQGGGAPGTIIDADGNNRIFYASGTTALTVAGLTLTGGDLTTAGSGEGGGAIYNTASAQLTVSDSAFTDNHATVTSASANGGGAIYVTSGPLLVSGSTFDDNTSTQTTGTSNNGGGAIFINDGGATISRSYLRDNTATVTSTGSTHGGGAVYINAGALSLTDSSVSGNTASVSSATTSNGGGGIYSNGANITVSGSSILQNTASTSMSTGSAGGGGIFDNSPAGTFIVTNSTLSGNSASPVGTGTGSGGGAIRRNTGTGPTLESSTITDNHTDGSGGGVLSGSAFSLKNTIFAANTAGAGANCSAPTITSDGNNIDDGTTCGLGADEHPSTNPLLGPLGLHGGSTLNQMPLAGSVAIGGGAGCPGSDQRGVTRPQAGACDIGADEVEPPEASTGDASSIATTSAVLSATVTPHLSLTNAHFEYGTTAGYGSSTPATSMGEGEAAVPVEQALGGLTKDTLYHYRIVATNATGIPVVGDDQTFVTSSPVTTVSGFKLSPSAFAVGRASTPRTAVKHGSSFRYLLDQASVVTIKIYRLRPGRLIGRRCRPPSRVLIHRKRCNRARRMGTLTRRKAKAGSNRTKFTGRIGRKALVPGHYRATITAKAPGVGSSTARSARFRIVRG
jgi:hypothetical protein